jgi:hypothetical protein
MPSKFPMPAGPNPRGATQQQVNIDLSAATDVVCANCGNPTFNEVFLMKHFSDVSSPTGKAVHVPFPTFACNSCGWVNDEFVPLPMRPKGDKTTQETPSQTTSRFDALGHAIEEAPKPEVTKIEIVR